MTDLATILVIAAGVALAFGVYCDWRATRRNDRMADDVLEEGHDA